MITPFGFATPKIIFGKGRIKELPVILSRYGRNIVLVTGKNSFMTSSYGKGLIEKLQSENISYRQVTVPGEPSPDIVDSAVFDLSGFKPDAVVAIGGGSAMDAGKAISAMLLLNESVVDYLEDVGTKEHPGTKVPFIAVPTTSGTGTEATKNAVLSRTGKNGFKKSLRHENILPDIALIDPELTINCSPAITAASGMDCFTQLTESYLSTKSNPMSDAITSEGIKAVRDSLVECFRNGDNIEARSGMSFAALASGIGLANAGLGTVHGIAGAIGGIYEIPHGLLCGTLMAACNDLTVRKLRKTGSNPAALKKYASLGRMFFEDNSKSDDYLTDAFINKLNELTLALRLPGLKTAGVEESSFSTIIAASSSKNNPVKFDDQDLYEVLSMRFV
ncbi:MAG TPA: iron-containing alcohol dehydrogenase [Bacteroidales bacterium]|nr:iron-containing alcohol dehydrogenase [Bacteroidales bacterium]